MYYVVSKYQSWNNRYYHDKIVVDVREYSP